MNNDRERELRRQRSNLRSLALGITVFGLWSVLKVAVSALLTPVEKILNENEEALALVTESGTRYVIYIVVLVFILIFSSIDLIPRFYVARKARRESLGQNQGMAWMVCAVVMFVVWVIIVIEEILSFPKLLESTATGQLDTVISLGLDITATVILGKLCVTAFRIRKIKRGED